MQSQIEIKGWEDAQVIARALTNSGYEVLITTDGHVLPDGERSYMLYFVHPEYTGNYFEIVDEEQPVENKEEMVTWEQVKEGLEHLESELPKKKAKK